MIILARRVSSRLTLLTLIAALAACSAPSATPVAVTSLPDATATSTVVNLPTVTAPRSPPSNQEIYSRLDTYLTKLTSDQSFVGSVLIARDGVVLLSNGYGEADREKKAPNTTQTKFRIASITKQFTAMAILILQSQGKLDVWDRLCAYVPNCPPAWKTITLHQLLTHTSGLPNFHYFTDWETFRATPAAPSDTIARFIDKSLDFQPGEKWSYSDSGYVTLGAIIEQVSGRTYEEFIKDYIFTPLKMADTGYLDHPQGMAVGYGNATTASPADFVDMSVLYAAGGLYSTVGDLYLWDQSLFTDKLLPKDLREEMFTPYVSTSDGSGLGYGYGWYIGNIDGSRVVGHPGEIEGFSSLNLYYPDEKIVVILLGNQEHEPVTDIGVHLATIVFEGK